MAKYKTAVVDYEGMQGCLDHHTAQGWRLFCCNADTWRKVEADVLGEPVGREPGGYSASYYLLIFVREEGVGRQTSLAEVEEEIPQKPHRRGL